MIDHFYAVQDRTNISSSLQLSDYLAEMQQR
jgi:hypothetical protein